MKWQDIQGWFPEVNARILEKEILKHDVRTVIEIGSFLGRSTAFFAGCVHRVYAIDPFVMWEEGRQNGDAMRAGEDFFEQFVGNMNACDVGDVVDVIRRTSKDAAIHFPMLEADMVFIDGSHDRKSVLLDIALWAPRARKVVAGDDYDENWPGVIRGVGESFDQFEVSNNIWIKSKMAI